jgi:hypothetical protein
MTDIAGRSAVEGDCPVDPTMLPTAWGKNTCAAGETTAGLMFVQGLNARDVYGRADYTGDDMQRWLVDEAGRSTLTPGVFGREAEQESGVLWGDRKERARRLIAAGRADEDLLSGGKAVELVEAAAVAAATATVVRLTDPQPAAQAKEATARDIVLASAAEVADGRGIVDKDTIIAATAGMKDGTRNRALTDLVGDGALRRIKNGLYEVPGKTKASDSVADQQGTLL